MYTEEILNKILIDGFIYKQWLPTDRTTLQTVSQSAKEFNETFPAGLQILKKHDFIAKERSKFSSNFLIADFAKNYSFILQDTAQSTGIMLKPLYIHLFVTTEMTKG